MNFESHSKAKALVDFSYWSSGETSLMRNTAQAKLVSILGSTGSIGSQTLELVSRFSSLFQVDCLAAGTNSELLMKQVETFRPRVVSSLRPLDESFRRAHQDTTFISGEGAIEELVDLDNSELVIGAVVGFQGLRGVLRSIRAGRNIALANKESIVCAGRFLREELDASGSRLYPVDSEHAAAFQVLSGLDLDSELQRLVITASGGAFRDLSLAEMQAVTPKQALKHPNWDMGPKVTIDSASLFNKALEMIEAKWLFGLRAEQVAAVIHPSSQVHAAAALVDGSLKLSMAEPDMALPIAQALFAPSPVPERIVEHTEFGELSLEFREIDQEKYPSIRLARECMERGNESGLVLNLANEVAVEAFVKGKLSFREIYSFVEESLERFGDSQLSSIDELFPFEEELRARISRQIGA